MSIKDDIKNSKDLREEIYETSWKKLIKQENGSVEEKPIKVLIKELDFGQRLDIFDNPKYKTFDGQPDFMNIAPLIVIATVFDPDTGLPVFANTKEDVALIRSKSKGPMQDIINKALEVNAMEPDAQENAKNE